MSACKMSWPNYQYGYSYSNPTNGTYANPPGPQYTMYQSPMRSDMQYVQPMNLGQQQHPHQRMNGGNPHAQQQYQPVIERQMGRAGSGRSSSLSSSSSSSSEEDSECSDSEERADVEDWTPKTVRRHITKLLATTRMDKSTFRERIGLIIGKKISSDSFRRFMKARGDHGTKKKTFEGAKEFFKERKAGNVWRLEKRIPREGKERQLQEAKKAPPVNLKNGCVSYGGKYFTGWVGRVRISRG